MNNPSESVEQICLFRWARYLEGKYTVLKLMHHIPNGGQRNKATAARLKAEGVKAGVPDICLPVARGGYHGLYIELKASKGKVSKVQKEWIKCLNAEGYFAVVCHGWAESAEAIMAYLDGKITKEVDEDGN